jgi:chitinase
MRKSLFRNRPLRFACGFLLAVYLIIPVHLVQSHQSKVASNTTATSQRSSVTPVPETTPLTPFRIVAYYPAWRGTDFPPDKIPADKVSVINYAFALPTERGECVLGDANASKAHFTALRELRKSHPGLRIMLSVGGWGTEEKFEAATSRPASMKRFIASCAQLVKENGFDGIDLDWEYPTKAQKATFTTLIMDMRRTLDLLGRTSRQRYLFTIAAPSSPEAMVGIDLPKITPQLDWVNLMTYDFYGNWSNTTGHNAPLRRNPTDPDAWSVDDTVHLYLSSGVAAQKLILGVPFYGRGWQGVKDVNHGPFQPFSKLPQDSDDGSYRYDQIEWLYLDKIGDEIPRYWDERAKVPWLYDSRRELMISYDDPQSIGIKAAYARQHNLGGLMIWEITGDDTAQSLLKACSEKQ